MTTKNIEELYENTELVELQYHNALVEFSNKYRRIALSKDKMYFVYEDEDINGEKIIAYQSEQNMKKGFLTTKIKMLDEEKSSKNKKVYKTLKLVDFYMQNSMVSPYKGIDISVSYKGNDYLNLWQGFAVPVLKQQILEKEVALFTRLLKALSGSEDIYNHFIKYLAHMVQKTSEIPEVAIVITGTQGCGKNSLMELLFKMFHKLNYIEISDTKKLTGDFNKHLEAKVLIYADEAVFAYDKTVGGIMKNMITSNKMLIEEKGITPYTINSYTRLFISSNHQKESALIEENDRRYFVLDTTDELVGKQEFWDEYYDSLNNGDLATKVFNYLMQIDLTGYSPKKFPRGKTHALIAASHLPLPVQFLEEIAYSNYPEYKFHLDAVCKVKASALYESYKVFVKNKSVNDHTTLRAFCRQLKNDYGIQSVERADGTYYHLSANIIADLLSKITKNEILGNEIKKHYEMVNALDEVSKCDAFEDKKPIENKEKDIKPVHTIVTRASNTIKKEELTKEEILKDVPKEFSDFFEGKEKDIFGFDEFAKQNNKDNLNAVDLIVEAKKEKRRLLNQKIE